jgi:hypothetical protein
MAVKFHFGSTLSQKNAEDQQAVRHDLFHQQASESNGHGGNA